MTRFLGDEGEAPREMTPQNIAGDTLERCHPCNPRRPPIGNAHENRALEVIPTGLVRTSGTSGVPTTLARKPSRLINPSKSPDGV